MEDPFTIKSFWFEHRGGKYQVLKIGVVDTEKERVVPPAGEDHAFTVQHHRRDVEITVSPTGRVVHVYVDGVQV